MANKYRYLIYVSYIGTRYSGSQRVTSRGSPTDCTVQGALEDALSEVGLDNVIVTSASRTDRGVHSLSSPFTSEINTRDSNFCFSTQFVKDSGNFYLATNRHEIKINRVLLVPWKFHPQTDCRARKYIYRVAVLRENARLANVGRYREPLALSQYLPINYLYRITPLRLNEEKAHEAIELMNGTHDFASFTAKIIKRNPRTTVRTVDIGLRKREPIRNEQFGLDFDVYEFHVSSTSFLYNQVRRMVGAILSYCSYESVTLKRIKGLLRSPSTMGRGDLVLAQPWGLYLEDVHYPHEALIVDSAPSIEDDRQDQAEVGTNECIGSD